MKRYWIRAGNINVDNEIICKKLQELGFEYNVDTGDLSFKSEDLKETLETESKTFDLLKKYYGKTIKKDELITTVIQPECVDCEALLRFSDKFCSMCGGKSTGIRTIKE